MAPNYTASIPRARDWQIAANRINHHPPIAMHNKMSVVKSWNCTDICPYDLSIKPKNTQQL